MFLLLSLLVAQASSPQPSAPTDSALTISWPTHIDISASSEANFNRYNQGSGTIMVTINCNRGKSPMIPPALISMEI